MKFGTSALALCAFLAACGSGTPFNGKVDVDTGTDGSTGASAIPEALLPIAAAPVWTATDMKPTPRRTGRWTATSPRM